MVVIKASHEYCEELQRRLCTDLEGGLIQKEEWLKAIRLLQLCNTVISKPTINTSLPNYLNLLTQGRGTSTLQLSDYSRLFADITKPKKASNKRQPAQIYLDENIEPTPELGVFSANLDMVKSNGNRVFPLESSLDLTIADLQSSKGNFSHLMSPFSFPSRFMIVADNYLFEERIHNVKRNIKQWIDGLVEQPQSLEHLLFVVEKKPLKEGAKEKEYELFLDEIRSTLLEMKLSIQVGVVIGKRKTKGSSGSRHDRHIFTSYGQFVSTDSLNLYKWDSKSHLARPNITDTFTLSYRPYTKQDKLLAFSNHLELIQNAIEDPFAQYGVVSSPVVKALFQQFIITKTS